MDTYSILKALAACDQLTSTQKLVGCMVAYHLNKKTGNIRVKQETIARECALSRRAVSAAIVRLVDLDFFTRTRTVRTDVLTPSARLEIVCGIDQCAPGLHSNAHHGYTGNPQHTKKTGTKNRRRRKTYDDTFACPSTSTPAEERLKREEARHQAELKRRMRG